jgi:phospholipase/carboxylesterase
VRRRNRPGGLDASLRNQAACSARPDGQRGGMDDRDPARLRARPAGHVEPGRAAGTFTLGGGALLQVPSTAAAGTPSPLVVLFHGAGSSAHAGIGLLRDHGERAGLLLLAPQSGAATWDVIHGGFGPDVERLDDDLAEVFASCPVAADHIALGGFSDGASYALSLGLGNGDLVSDLVAFSPGFVRPAGRSGRPRIFVTHGTRDPVLPIQRSSRRIV